MFFDMRKGLTLRENIFVKYIEEKCKEAEIDIRKSKIKDNNKGITDTTLFLVVFEHINEFMTFFIEPKNGIMQFPITTARKFGKRFPQKMKLSYSNIDKLIEILKEWKSIKTYTKEEFEL